MKGSKILCCVLLLIALTGCNEHVLLSSLDQRQANEVVAVLQSYDIDATQKSSLKGGYSIFVDKKQFVDAVNLVDYYDLPAKPRIEIAQMFPEDSLVASPIAEKARLYSAIEQRLEQSLKTLQGVITASLHLSYDVSDTQKKHGQDVHLTTIVRYEVGFDDQLLIADIKRFLKNSFNDVDYENISVVMTPAKKFEHTSRGVKHNPTTDFLLFFIVIGLVFMVVLAALVFKFKKQLFFNKQDNGEKIDNSTN